ncbi:MAG: hypothetical protein KC591_08855, partial [Gemmatimonadetes bacterium]|nr:hypothetical protein [Gemmatimonadota bacterium]
MCLSPSSRRHSPSLARLPLLLLLSAVVAAPAFASRPEVRAPTAGRATVPGSRGATSDTLWIPVHPTGTSPCSPGDAVGSPDDQTVDEIWCFEGAGGDSTWPAGPAGAHFDHWSRYAPPNPPESRWHVTTLYPGPSTGTYNAWLGCDTTDPLGACSDVDGWA